MAGTGQDHIGRGVAAQRAGRLEDALAEYRAAVAAAPDDAEAQSLLGLLLVQLDRLEEAAASLIRATQLEPDQAGFVLNLGEFYEKTGDTEAMLEQARKAIALMPDHQRGWHKLGDGAVALGRLQDAADAYEKALARDPANAVVAAKLARVKSALGDVAGALVTLDLADRLRPGHDAQFQLRAEIAAAQRDWKTLNATGRDWSETHPKNPQAWRYLAAAAMEQGRYREAAAAYRGVLETSPRDAATLAAYAMICLRAQDNDAAASALDEAEALDADSTAMLGAKANLLATRGEDARAEHYCRRALAQDPANIPAYTILSLVTRGQLAEREMAALARLAADSSLQKESRVLAAFALGHGHDARGEIDAAFAAYETAHALRRERNEAEGSSYDAAQAAARAHRIAALFAQAPTAGTMHSGYPRPIFIVGMPRAGTALIENVLAAHSRVTAMEERPRLQQILNAYLALRPTADAPEPSAAQLDDWRAAYFQDVPAEADRIIDSFPLNFEAVGLIALLFAGAAIVHARRSPLETGLSIFRHELPKVWTFADDLGDIADLYGHYARLMAHWERAFAGRVVTVQAEDFAGDFVRAAPALVAACGLEWEDACAASRNAMPQSGRAERYRHHLEPLRAALEAADVDPVTGAVRRTH